MSWIETCDSYDEERERIVYMDDTWAITFFEGHIIADWEDLSEDDRKFCSTGLIDIRNFGSFSREYLYGKWLILYCKFNTEFWGINPDKHEIPPHVRAKYAYLSKIRRLL